MKDEDIQQFMKAFDDFMKHADVEQYFYQGKMAYLEYQNSAKKIIHDEIEQKAAELEVTVDYYLAEFM